MSKLVKGGYFTLLILTLIFQGCEVSKAKREFDDNFDLELTGRVIDVKPNQYGQKLVCLEVIKSNYQDYFPIHNPNKNLEDNTEETWEKRFFVKVQNKKAVFIFRDKKHHRYMTNHIVKGAIITINENNNKAFSIYDKSKRKEFGGLKIQTSPIRNNLENSCLSKK